MVGSTGRRFNRALLVVVLVVVTFAGAMRPAQAVDRTLGAGVPKPSRMGAPWTPEQRTALAVDLDAQIAAAATLRHAHVGILVVDARDGTLLYARNPDDALMPASTFKLLTGSAALDRLGPDFRFQTTAFAEGPIVRGVLHGRLVLRGGGDPLLNAADLEGLAQAVAGLGITRIDGPIDIDTTHFVDPPYMPGWSWDDFPFYYAPKISALSFEDNVVHLSVVPARAAGGRATVTATPYGRVGEPPSGCATTSDVIVIPRAMTGPAGSNDTVDVERDPGGCILVTGSIPLGGAPDTIDAAVPNPEAYAWHVLADRLHAHAITFPEPSLHAGFAQSFIAAPARPGARALWSHDSEPLADLLADCWFPSDNLLAELLLKATGAAGGEPGSAASGIAFETLWLASLGVDTGPLSIDDGSGLSSYDRMTPRALVAILQHDWDGPQRDLVLDDLPLSGVRGSLKSSFVGTLAERTVFAKTGSVSHVRTLAGYAATQAHGAVIFSFQVGDWTGMSTDIAAVRARFLSRIIGDR